MKYPQQKLTRYKALIFDFDGTLVPCLDLHAMKQQILEFTLKETGIARDEIAHMMMVEFIEHTREWLVARGNHGHNYYDRAHDLVKKIELDAAATTNLFPGTLALLNSLKSQGLKIGIVTRNCEQALRLMSPSIDTYCDALVARDQANFLKPDPRHLSQCLQQMGVEPMDSLMVGDGIVDIQLAQALDVDSVGVLGGHNSAPELMAASPTWLIEHVNELAQYLVD